MVTSNGDGIVIPADTGSPNHRHSIGVKMHVVARGSFVQPAAKRPGSVAT